MYICAKPDYVIHTHGRITAKMAAQEKKEITKSEIGERLEDPYGDFIIQGERQKNQSYTVLCTLPNESKPGTKCMDLISVSKGSMIAVKKI